MCVYLWNGWKGCVPIEGVCTFVWGLPMEGMCTYGRGVYLWKGCGRDVYLWKGCVPMEGVCPMELWKGCVPTCMELMYIYGRSITAPIVVVQRKDANFFFPLTGNMNKTQGIPPQPYAPPRIAHITLSGIL